MKEKILKEKLIKLLKTVLLYQYENCKEYKNICKYFKFKPQKLNNFSEIPYLTSTVFKENLISSIQSLKFLDKLTQARRHQTIIPK